MAYTRTGRPPGRPKTKEYVTLMARVPQDLADQARRYAGLKQQTLSEVLREGLVLLLQEDAPYSPFVSDRNSLKENVSDSISRSQSTIQENVSDRNIAPEIMSDNNTLPCTEAPEILSDTNTVLPIMSDTHRVPAPLSARTEDTPALVAPTSGVQAENLSDMHGVPAQQTLPCGHPAARWNAQRRVCLECDKAHARERRKAQRQAPPAAPVPASCPPAALLRDKAAILAQLDAWKAEGVSLQTMVDRLDAAGVPTFRGKMVWSKGTIGNLLAKRQGEAVAPPVAPGEG